MSEEIKSTRKFSEKLKDNYRLVVYETEDHKEIGNYQFSLRRFYFALISILLLIITLVSLVFVFTPIRKLLPGYGDMEKNAKFLSLQNEVRDLELALQAQDIYNENLRKLVLSDGSQISSTSLELNKTDQSKDDGLINEVYAERQLLAELLFVPPLSGEVSASFDREVNHLGVDIITKSNSEIRATLDGVVISSGWDVDTGFTIGIQHSHNVLSFYKHNSKILKEIGDRVIAGEAIAITGNTGILTNGPHLHFEIWHNGLPIDPEKLMKFVP